MPDVTVNSDFGWGPGDLVSYGFESEAVDFQRSTGVTGWRLDLYPTTSLNFVGPGYFVRPSVGYRATQYQLSNTVPGEPAQPSRTLPIASLDTGLQLERAAGSRDQRTITLEPRAMYLYVPYATRRSSRFSIPPFLISIRWSSSAPIVMSGRTAWAMRIR